MLTSWKSLVCAVALGTSTLLSTARAETPEEIAQMAQKGMGEDVLMTVVDRSAGFNLTADQIIKLKDAGVSDKVIAAMMRKKLNAPAAPAAPATPAPNLTIGAAPTPAPAPAAQVAEAGQGTLNIENVDDRSWGYRLDGQNRVLWILPVDQNTQSVVQGHGGLSLSVPAGNYEIRYTGEGIGAVFTVAPNAKSLVLFSRVENSDFEGLYASVFENGERKGGGRLAVLRQGGKPNFQQVQGATNQQVAQAPVQAQQVQPTQPAPTYTYEQQPQTQIVERTEPSTTVIYRDPPVVYTQPYTVYPYSPYYYNTYPYRPYYSSPYYYNTRPGVSIGIGGGSHHSGTHWGVGFGF